MPTISGFFFGNGNQENTFSQFSCQKCSNVRILYCDLEVWKEWYSFQMAEIHRKTRKAKFGFIKNSWKITHFLVSHPHLVRLLLFWQPTVSILDIFTPKKIFFKVFTTNRFLVLCGFLVKCMWYFGFCWWKSCWYKDLHLSNHLSKLMTSVLFPFEKWRVWNLQNLAYVKQMNSRSDINLDPIHFSIVKYCSWN